MKNQKKLNPEKEAMLKGIRMAAELAGQYNSSSTHPYDLEDCILAKLNMLPKNKIRKNKSRLKIKDQ